MPNVEEKKVPYELLCRWDRDGKLSGAHVGFRALTIVDGVVKGEVVEPPQRVSLGGSQGFPLADVLEHVQSTALVRVDELTAQVEALSAECQANQAVIAKQQEVIAAFENAMRRSQDTAGAPPA